MRLLFPVWMIMLLLAVACSNPSQAPTAEVSDSDSTLLASTDGPSVAYQVDTAATIVAWKASKVTGSHMGFIPVTDGVLNVRDSLILNGGFDLALNRVQVTDLTGASKAKLETHLKSADFFDVAQFPSASFSLLELTPVEGDTSRTHNAKGELLMHGVAKRVRFPVKLRWEGARLIATSQFTIDRKQWKIEYAGAPDNLIRNEVELTIYLEAAPALTTTPAVGS